MPAALFAGRAGGGGLQGAPQLERGVAARALKLLGRVLEIEPDDKRAASMLDKVRIRGQRMRQAMAARITSYNVCYTKLLRPA